MTEKFNEFQQEAIKKATTFETLLSEMKLSPDDEKVTLMKEVWNKALASASEYFSEMEGTDYDLEKALGVEVKK